MATNREAEQLRTDLRILAQATADQLAKLLTLYIRGDRFCDGALASAYDDGLLVGILNRAAVLLEETADGGEKTILKDILY